MPITTYRDLDAYQRAMKAVVAVRKTVLNFPEYERFGSTDQIRRASKSAPTNIGEGYGKRKSAREFKHYPSTALGSANEMIVHLEIARDLEYALPEVCNSLIEDYTIICKMLYRLIENWHTIPAKEPIKNSPSDL